MKEAADLDMSFEDFVQAYTRDMKPKLKENNLEYEGNHY